MTIINQDFTMWQGDAKSIVFTITDASGNPYDLTDVENINWALSALPVTDALIQKSKTGGGISVNSPATDGIFTVTLEATDTAALVGAFYHEAQIIDSEGNPDVVATGTATINASNL